MLIIDIIFQMTNAYRIFFILCILAYTNFIFVDDRIKAFKCRFKKRKYFAIRFLSADLVGIVKK